MPSASTIQTFTQLSYLIAAALFILGLKRMSSPVTAVSGVRWAGVGMLLATIVTLAFMGASSLNLMLVIIAIAIGTVIAWVSGKRVAMTDMPQMIALYNGMGGGAAAAIAAVELYSGNEHNLVHLTMAAVGGFIGAVSFSGSLIAFAKLQGLITKSVRFSGQKFVNLAILLITVGFGFMVVSGAGADSGLPLVSLFFVFALILGVAMTLPIGGADMPVVISMLNSYSGWAAAGIGFTLGNSALIITGALVGSSGAILSYIMCHAMNRSFISVILGGFGGETAAAAGGTGEARPVKLGSADDAAFIMKNAQKVIIVPGYGMAVAQAQHALREMADTLKKEGVEVKYAIHPVAGRMPGHMNVLLAEANVPYDEVFELEDINSEFAQADVAFVIGANDVTNPAAEDDKTSPIYGMPVLQVWKAGTVMFIKRSLASGYAGIDNPLFYRDNTMMLLGDAKKMTESIVKAM
jgi:NAD(P) transhydrogenase subunit beta